MLQELEKPILPKQKKQVIEAIQALGLRVSPSEVAEKADLPLLVAGRELNRLATETGAHLQVTASGAVAYVFDPRFEQSYALVGPRKFFQRATRFFVNFSLLILRTLALVGIFLFRISFGVLLICSVVALVVVAVMAILALLDQGEDAGLGGDGGIDLGDLGGVGGDVFSSQWSLSFWCFDFLWDWIFFPRYMWGPYWGPSYGWGYSYYDYDYWGNDSYNSYSPPANVKVEPPQGQSKKPRTRFLDSCFGLLFGAGNPNVDLERQRWHDIAAVIRLNQGVVVCEQLAPYLDGNKENEDWMLPILLRFNGLPDVTETGHIIYLFPDFISALSVSSPGPAIEPTEQSEDAATIGDAAELRALYTGHLNRQKVINKSVERKASLERYLNEQGWVLLPEDGEYESVYLFVGLAVALSLLLLYESGSVAFLHSFVPLFYAILSYASIFIIFPAIRWFLNARANEAIEARNDKRLEASAKLASASGELQQKLDEARVVAISGLARTDNRIAYTTEKDVLEQQFE